MFKDLIKKRFLSMATIIGLSIPGSKCGVMDYLFDYKSYIKGAHEKLGYALGVNSPISKTDLISGGCANMLFRLRDSAKENVMVVTRSSDGRDWQVWKPFGEEDGFVPLEINLEAINNNGAGYFSSWYPSDQNGMNKMNRIMVADFNGDGRDDLIFRPPGSSFMKVLLMDFEGKFTGKAISVPDPVPDHLNRQYDFIFVDYNHDGRDDLLVIDRDGSFKYYKNDNNMFSLDLEAGVLEGSIFGQELYKVNGKILKFDAGKTGKLDLMVINPESLEIDIYRSNGRKFNKAYPTISMKGFFDPNLEMGAIQREISRQNSFFALDLDRDGFDDLLFRDAQGKFTYLIWMGDDLFAQGPRDPETMHSWNMMGGSMKLRSDDLGLFEEGTILPIDSPSDQIGAGIIFYSPFTMHFNYYTINPFGYLSYENHASNEDFAFDYGKIHQKFL